MHVPTPMRPADWSLARLLQGWSAQTQTLTPAGTVFLCVANFSVILFQGITSSTKNTTIQSRPMKIAECAALDCTSARFGFSLANIGDLDQDGYEGARF